MPPSRTQKGIYSNTTCGRTLVLGLSMFLFAIQGTAALEGSSLRHTAKSPRFFVVVVGISNYQGVLSDLRFSDDDAVLFMSYLKKAFPREMAAGKSVLLLNQQATHDNIFSALEDVFSQSTDDDYILFYFSGHGSPGTFIPADQMSHDLSHAEVKKRFSEAKARYRLCIADACFSGSIAADTPGTDTESSTAELRDARVAIIMSSRPSQSSREMMNLQQGLFTYYFIKGLTGPADSNKDGYIMVGELFQYVRKTVAEKSRNNQVPVIYGTNLNRIPMARIRK